MAQKTQTYTLNVLNEDPATNKGIIAIYKVTFFRHRAQMLSCDKTAQEGTYVTQSVGVFVHLFVTCSL